MPWGYPHVRKPPLWENVWKMEWAEIVTFGRDWESKWNWRFFGRLVISEIWFPRRWFKPPSRCFWRTRDIKIGQNWYYRPGFGGNPQIGPWEYETFKFALEKSAQKKWFFLPSRWLFRSRKFCSSVYVRQSRKAGKALKFWRSIRQAILWLQFWGNAL